MTDSMTNPMTLETARTRLRRFEPTDAGNVHLLLSDADVVKFIPYRVPQTFEQTELRLKAWLEKEVPAPPFGIWAVELKGSGDFVGWFMLQKQRFEGPELGFMITRNFWGQGLTTEVSRLLLERGFENPSVEKIYAVTDEANIASKAVLEKLGFKFSHEMIQADPVLKKDCRALVWVTDSRD